MLTVYGDIQSGNCYKLKWLLEYLGKPYRWQHVDILKGETRTPEFLAKNPNGKLPVLELEDGRCLSESNAILCFLAERSSLLPSEGFERARVMQWLFFEQYSHEPYIATARFIVKYLGRPADREADLQAKMPGGYKALAVMEQQLVKTPFIAGESLTLADIALYAYTRVAHEGCFDLSEFPAIKAWLERLQSLTPKGLI